MACVADGRSFTHEDTRSGQELLRRAIVRRGVPQVLYADQGAPFHNAWLARTCAVLGMPPARQRGGTPLHVWGETLIERGDIEISFAQ